MNWYYAEAGQQAGPVDDTQLQDLVRTGRIQASTLVWREGMTDWRPYQEVAAGAGLNLPPPPTISALPRSAGAPTEAVCAECNRIFDKSNMIQVGDLHVCATCKPIVMQKLAEGAKIGVSSLNYAGFWIRAGAKIIDGLILGVPFGVVYMVFFFGSFQQSIQQPGVFQPNPWIYLVQFGFFVVRVAYTTFFLGRFGATPGKMACGLKVVTSDGGRVSYARALGRFFGEMLSGLVCCIGYIIVGFDKEKRALHDHICNTRVIYK